MARLEVGAWRGLAVVAASVVLLLSIAVPGADAATSILPCPKVSGGTMGIASFGGVPRPLNPCPGGEWAKVFGGYENATGVDILPTADGGYAVLGEVRPPGNWDVWILKLNATGAVEWQNFYGGAGRERPSVIRQTSDGGYIVAAETHSFGFGSRDAWLLKLDALGQIEWQNVYGSPGDDAVNDVWPTADGGYVMVGLTNSVHLGRRSAEDYFKSVDAWIAKLDSAGSVVWQKVYGVGKPGDSNHECFNAVRQTADGGYIAAGTRSLWQSSGFVPSTWLVRLDASGGIVWQNTYGKGSGGQLCGGVMWNNPDVLITPDGGYIVDPVYFYGPEPNDGYAMKVDASGRVQWRIAYGTPQQEWFVSEDIVTSDGGYIFTGLLRDSSNVNHPWVVRTDAAGNLLWQATYGMSAGMGNANGIAGRVDPRGGIVLTGIWVGHGLTVMKIWGTGNPGTCDDLTIGLGSDAVQRDSRARPSQSQAGVGTPPNTVTATSVVPWASNATEDQLCSS